MGLESIDKHPLAERFYRLTPDEVADAVEVGGLRCTGRFTPLNSYENRVYQLELDDGSLVVGKFYRPGRWSRAAIAEEHRFISELAAAGVPVAEPMALASDTTIGEVVGIHYALFPKVPGRVPQELDDQQVKELGRLLARMHEIGSRRQARERSELSPATYGRQELDHLLAEGHLPPEVRAAYTASVEALLTRIQPLFRGVPMHRIHADCHLGNLLWTRTGPVFVDFDDMTVGPAVQDVWMLVPSADEEGQRQRRLLVESYTNYRAFDPGWLRLVEPLRALRFIRYATWIARRRNDPSFRRTFPDFGTVQYWEREVQDLREQIARIDAASY